MKTKIVIIGGGAGGMTAAAQLGKIKEKYEVTVIEKGDKVSWAGCPTPYYISGELSIKSIVHFLPQYFIDMGINVKINSVAEKIDRKNKKVIIIEEGLKKEIKYDKLIVSTGGKAIRPEIKGISGKEEWIFKLSNADDAIKIKKYIENNKLKKAIIVGSGFVGLEMAEAFYKNGIGVKIIEKAEKIFPWLNDAAREKVINMCKEKGIELITGSSIKNIKTIKNQNSIILENGNKLECDILLFSIGIKPNIEIIENSGVKLEGGKLIPNCKLKIEKDIYAIGDLIHIKNIITGEIVHAPFGDVADKQALLVVKDILGEKINYKGVQGSYATSFFEIKIAGTGINLKKAKELGIAAESLNVKVFFKNAGFLDSKSGDMEVVYDVDKKIVLGAFMIGYEAVAQFVDLISIVISKKIPIKEFMDFDYCYSPTNSVVWNPMLAIYRKLYK